jgi:hypothetical protein
MQVHLPFLNSPLFGSNPVIVAEFLYPMALHLRDHLLNYYLIESHNAISMAQSRELIPEEAEQEVAIILEVQKFIETQLGGFGQELEQIYGVAQQYKPQPPMPNDERMKIAELGAQIKQDQLAQKTQMDQAKMQMDSARMQLDQMKATHQTQMDQLKMQQAAEIEAAKMREKEIDRQEDAKLQGLREMGETERQNIREANENERQRQREANENERKLAELATRERINTSDNETAKLLAAAEIATDEKVAVSTGTGIDPDPSP